MANDYWYMLNLIFQVYIIVYIFLILNLLFFGQVYIITIIIYIRINMHTVYHYLGGRYLCIFYYDIPINNLFITGV